MDTPSADWLLTDKVSSWPGSPAERGWRYLRQCLERVGQLHPDLTVLVGPQYDRGSPAAG